MRRSIRGWLIALGLIVVLVGSLAVYGLKSLRPPVSRPAAPIVTPFGTIRGTTEAGLTVYRGIPFAKPPIGALRWRAPAPTTWQGTLEATHFKPACMQIGGSLPGFPAEPTSEDCLGLNIWTPATHANQTLPVMIYMYGGGFKNGSSSPRLYWGDSLAQRGVVVVTFNYRLGVLGFLAHPELAAESPQHVSGNYALLDCIAVLTWVKGNIGAFGGNPDNVTLFGQSGGAYLGSELMASPLARGLFRRVIGMSGADMGTAGSGSDVPLKEQAEAAGVRFASSIGASSLRSLRQLSAKTLIERGNASDIAATYLPNIDGYVLPQEVKTALTTTAAADRVDLLVGIDAQEGATMIGAPLSVDTYTAMMRQRYGRLSGQFLARFPARTDAEAASSQVKLQTADVAWRTFTWARIHTRNGVGRTYGYVFSRVPPWPPFSTLHVAGHGSELPYLFGFPPRMAFFIQARPWTALRDAAIAEQVQAYWTNFAKTGDPNAPGLPPWAPYSADDSVLNFADSTRMESLPDRTGFSLMDTYWQSMSEPR